MISRFLSSLYIYCTHFLSPPSCLYCRQSLAVRQAFCSSCALQILPIVPFDFYVGKNSTIKVFAVSAYKDPLRSLILAKHRGNETYTRFLADFMVAQSTLQHLDFDVILFVPLHWTRYASRGFNQAEIIAQVIADRTGKPIIPLIIRSKKTQYQARLSLQQREQNVQDAFIINEKYSRQIVGKKILIVDDLFTTGSTIKAVAHILLPLQPAKIDVFVACRVVNS
jgi:ComF family protein